MKQISIEKLASNVETLVKLAPRQRILLTRNGRPFAFVSDASNYDWEDIGYMNDPGFWKMIAERRKEKGGILLEQLKTELTQREKGEQSSGSRRKAQRKRHKRSAA